MHKLAKGLKKKKKSKKGKKGAEEEDDFDPEELERYRRERAEALEKAATESTDEQEASAGSGTAATGSDEWKKFQALTAGIDSILKKTQGDLDRIKSTSFFQRKVPVIEEKKPTEDHEIKKEREKRYLGYDEKGNPIAEEANKNNNENKLGVTEEGFVEIPEDENEQEDSEEEDIFDTTYVDVLQNIDVQLAYIPDSPIEKEIGDDPFDTTSADKVLKTVDKRGKKVVSLGNAVEVLSGRIDHVSTCKLSRPRKINTQDLLLCDDNYNINDAVEISDIIPEAFEIEKTLLDDDSDIPEGPIDLTKLPTVLPPKPSVITDVNDKIEKKSNDIPPLDISEFEILKEKTILEEIPDLNDDDFNLNELTEESVHLEEANDPFAEKESNNIAGGDNEIIEVSFETATYADEDDPFDTGFADNLIPGKTELKFIEKELEELPESKVSISLTDPAGLKRDYETGLLTSDKKTTYLFNTKEDLLGGSTTDLTQLTDQPIKPIEELTYVDPFDTSEIHDIPPGKTELKFLEKELLGDSNSQQINTLEDNEFDPRKEETVGSFFPPSTEGNFQIKYENEHNEIIISQERKPSRPEVLGLVPLKSVAFELPTPSQRPDLLITGDEEKSIASKPLTPYYTEKSLEEELPENEKGPNNNNNNTVDPFDTSFVSKVTPGKTELKLIESELLDEEQPKLTHSISDQDFNPKNQSNLTRRKSDFGAISVRPKSLKISEKVVIDLPLIEDGDEPKNAFAINQAVHGRKVFESKRQESLLDAEVAVNAKPLTPRIESKIFQEEQKKERKEEEEEEVEREITYIDPFDTSIASNILPGKAELKLLESELNQIPTEFIKPKIINTIDLNRVSVLPIATALEDEDDFDPRASETSKVQDILSLDSQESGVKVLTPLNNTEIINQDIDPFDTSFATIEPGKTELKLLESELMEK